MRRLHILLFVLTITLVILVTLALVSWYFAATAPTYYGSSWMGQMWGSHLGSDGNYWGMGGMMGNGSGTTTSYLWIIPVTLIAVVAAAMIGVGFYLAFPELKYIRGKACSPQKSETPSTQVNTEFREAAAVTPIVSNISANSTSCDVLLKTMTPEEQKVLKVLINHKGKYLQKYVAKEAELSRLKTHRIVARFAQRGIVTIKEFGNTNEVLLSDWVATR
jgi:uncharacterized membrane protein